MNKYREFEEEFEETKKERKTARKIASRRDQSKHKKTDQKKISKHLKKATEKKLAQKSLHRGRVLAIFPEELSVEYEQKIYTCTLRGALKKEMTRVKNLVTVGDFVLFEKEGGSIVHIEERTSVLSRQEHLHRKSRQLIAANIDQVLITVSVVHPPLKPSLVDRYIIATFKGGMEPVIVVNKIDLLYEHEQERKQLEIFIQTYCALNIPVLALSAETGEGLEQLQEQMHNKASVFSGQSGVGKSSLINTMTQLSLPVGEVIRKTKKGMHTTSAAKLIPLQFGGWCIDTPGIRSFGIWDLQLDDLIRYFPEITDVATACKYPNCTHTHEPTCAVKSAVEQNQISQLRYDSYLKLLDELHV